MGCKPLLIVHHVLSWMHMQAYVTQMYFDGPWDLATCNWLVSGLAASTFFNGFKSLHKQLHSMVPNMSKFLSKTCYKWGLFSIWGKGFWDGFEFQIELIYIVIVISEIVYSTIYNI